MRNYYNLTNEQVEEYNNIPLQEYEQIVQNTRGQLSSMEQLLKDRQFEATYAAYGTDISCRTCRYRAEVDIGDGHNYCKQYECVLCKDVCQRYKPDNTLTKWIKENATFSSGWDKTVCNLSDEEADAIEELGGDIYADEPDEYTIQLVKMFVAHENKENN